MVATSGGMLCDFPHSREHCTLKPCGGWGRPLNQSHRPNCYCYVCDSPWGSAATGPPTATRAARCPPGARRARTPPTPAPPRPPMPPPTRPLPRSRRARRRSIRAAAAAAAAAGGGGGGGGGGGATTANYSITELMKQVTQVYPEEVREPQSMRSNLSLRPYQKQSLAFALNVERRPSSADQSLLPPVGSYPDPAAGNRNANCFGADLRRDGHGQDRGRHRALRGQPPAAGAGFSARVRRGLGGLRHAGGTSRVQRSGSRSSPRRRRPAALLQRGPQEEVPPEQVVAEKPSVGALEAPDEAACGLPLCP